MKIDIKQLPKSQTELTITVPYEVYQKWEKRALEDIGKQVKVAGFRPGHVPEAIVRQQVREDSIKMATLDYVLPQTYAEAVKKHDLQVIAHPKVDIKSEPKKEGDDFVYTAIVPVMPEVKMGNYRKIKIKKKKPEVTKKSIDETIEMIINRHAEWKDVDRKAKKGDRTEIAFEGFDKDGKTIPNTVSKNHPVILGSDTMIPGFEEEIVGMKRGEAKTFDITFPKDYHAEAMKGKKVKFEVTLNRLEEKLDQKLDDNLVEKITGHKQSVDAFKKQIEEELSAELEQKNKQEHENKIVKEIVDLTKVDLPDALIDQEIEEMLNEHRQRLKQQGLDWELFLKHVKKTEEEFKNEHRQSAEERVKARLGIQTIIREEKIEISKEELGSKIEEMTAHYPESEKKKIVDYYEKDKEAAHFLKNSMAADKLFAMFTK